VGPTPVKSAKKWAPPICHVAVGDKAISAVLPHGSTRGITPGSTHQQINFHTIKPPHLTRVIA
jgi:hypothetical protein